MAKKQAKPEAPALLADQLREAVRQSGQTSYRLAKDSGVGQPTIDRFMSGERDIVLATAGKLAAALGLELRRVK